PTKTDTRAASSEWLLRFEFVKSGTRVVSVKDGAVFATAQILAKVGRPVAHFQFARPANQLSPAQLKPCRRSHATSSGLNCDSWAAKREAGSAFAAAESRRRSEAVVS